MDNYQDTKIASNPTNPDTQALQQSDTALASSSHDKKNELNLKLLIGVPILIWVVAIASVLIYVSVGAGPHDTNTEHDLNTISMALISADNLPSNLNQLNLVGLHYNVSNYTYSTLPPSSNAQVEANSPSGFKICATFDSNGLDPSSKSADFTSMTQLKVFSYHNKGNQCYYYTYAEYGIGQGTTDVIPIQQQ
ncbi:MAG: hypothetical protein ACHQT9_00805 [Candidatus Saccharimonadales bacterium]